MQTAKANSKSKQSGKTAVRTPAVSEAVAAQAQDPVAAGSPDMKPAEPQATDIGAVNPVAETSPAEQPAAHPETDVRLLDLNKIVNSTYNPCLLYTSPLDIENNNGDPTVMIYSAADGNRITDNLPKRTTKCLSMPARRSGTDNPQRSKSESGKSLPNEYPEQTRSALRTPT